MARVPPSSIPLPPSPQHSQSEFEALVDLLGTDTPMQSRSTREKEATNLSSLRDSEGRLDFNKIKSMFLTETDKLNLDGDKITPEVWDIAAYKGFAQSYKIGTDRVKMRTP
ncbi:MAG TPA: hypothetical protein VGO47_02625 [Chlamydiales bacterium]|jgi:hypothetical protein|nr:hypothetical protein [Chlamydiales bacterium]